MPRPKAEDLRKREVATRLNEEEGALLDAVLNDMSDYGPAPREEDAVRWLILQEAGRRGLVWENGRVVWRGASMNAPANARPVPVPSPPAPADPLIQAGPVRRSFDALSGDPVPLPPAAEAPGARLAGRPRQARRNSSAG